MPFTAEEICALKHLAPMYRSVRGKSEEEKKDFMKKAYLIWADYCPLYRSIDMDKDEFEWRKKCQYEV